MRGLLLARSTKLTERLTGLLAQIGHESITDLSALGDCDYVLVDANDSAAEYWIDAVRDAQNYWIPIACLVNSERPSQARHGLAQGADLLLCSDSSDNMVQMQLMALDRMAQNVHSLYKQEQDLHHFVLLDPDTGLLNLHGFTAALQKFHAKAKRERDCISLVLTHVREEQPLPPAGFLKCATRPGDELGRLAARQYAVLVPGADDAGASVIANRVVELGDWVKQVAVATCHPDYPVSAPELLSMAQDALALGTKRNQPLIRVDARSQIAYGLT